MSYKVYTCEYLGAPVNHAFFFVQTEDEGGMLYHVVGTILMGMKYESKKGKEPSQSGTHVEGTQTFIGHLRHSDVARFEAVSEAIPPPGKQVNLRGAPLDPSIPLRRCGEWVNEVKAKCLDEGIIIP